MYPCDDPVWPCCPYDAETPLACYNFCGLGADEDSGTDDEEI